MSAFYGTIITAAVGQKCILEDAPRRRVSRNSGFPRRQHFQADAEILSCLWVQCQRLEFVTNLAESGDGASGFPYKS